jgi:limonene-1,2-epoxide hydrolase
MEIEQFTRWLQAYGRAWEQKDPQAAGRLFTTEATYQETPFEAPLEGRQAIVAYWTDVPKSQEQIHFHFEILAVAEESGIAHWWAEFNRRESKAHVQIDGILTAKINQDNRCSAFREWWYIQEEKTEQ